jgi:hypothetical protein
MWLISNWNGLPSAPSFCFVEALPLEFGSLARVTESNLVRFERVELLNIFPQSLLCHSHRSNIKHARPFHSYLYGSSSCRFSQVRQCHFGGGGVALGRRCLRMVLAQDAQRLRRVSIFVERYDTLPPYSCGSSSIDCKGTNGDGARK